MNASQGHQPAAAMRNLMIAIVLALALLVTACGGGDDDADTRDSASSDDTTSVAEPELEPEPESEPADDSDDTDDDVKVPLNDDDPIDADETAPLEDDEQLTSEGEGERLAEDEAQYGGEVNWGLTNDGTGFDTTGAIAPGAIRIIGALVDTLTVPTVDGDWRPWLAESIVPNDDFTVWTITVRDGITFHDGEPLNGEAVRANLQAFNDGPTTNFAFAPVEEIVVVDDMVVEVRMNSPWASFPPNLVGQAGWMVSPSTIGQNDTFVSTGAFMLESWTPGDGARVVRNPNYWREGLPYLDAINFKFLVDQTVKRQALEAGDVQGYISPGDEDILEWLDDDSVDVWIGEAGANERLFLLNTTREPLDDIRVRRALAHATDRQFIIDTFRSGLTRPASGPISPASRWYAETDYPEFDPEKAAALIAEYEAEVGPVVLELTAEPSEVVFEEMEVLISFWEDVGIEATTRQIGGGQSALTAIQDDFQVFSWFQFGGSDPDGLYPFMHSNAGILNWTNLVSEDIDEGLDIGRQNPDFDTRYEGYAQLQRALADEVPFIWIDHLNGVEAAVTIPELNGVGQPREYEDGAIIPGMISGSFFSWAQVWLEQ